MPSIDEVRDEIAKVLRDHAYIESFEAKFELDWEGSKIIQVALRHKYSETPLTVKQFTAAADAVHRRLRAIDDERFPIIANKFGTNQKFVHPKFMSVV